MSPTEVQIRSKLEVLCRQLGRTDLDFDFVERQCRYIADLANHAKAETDASQAITLAA